jgi:hypothetical protein
MRHLIRDCHTQFQFACVLDRRTSFKEQKHIYRSRKQEFLSPLFRQRGMCHVLARRLLNFATARVYSLEGSPIHSATQHPCGQLSSLTNDN